MGNVSADGQYLWLSGRYDDVVYRFDTSSGGVDKIKVGREPHGLDRLASARPLFTGAYRQPALAAQVSRSDRIAGHRKGDGIAPSSRQQV